jgi:5-methylcytosine-specific restriction endonuclease McrA
MTQPPQLCTNCDAEAYCKGMCAKHYKAARYQANKEKLKAKQREYYAENREAALANKKLYYQENRDEIQAKSTLARAGKRDETNAKAAVYREENREAIRLRQAEYRQKNPMQWRDWARRNAAKVAERNFNRRSTLGVGGGVSQRDWDRAVASYDGKCAYCNERPEGALSMDHVVPVSRGGSHSIGNIVPACLSCNSSKKDRLLIEWRARRALVAA